MTDLGVMASMTQNLDPATCVAVVEGFGKIVAGADDEWEDEYVKFAFSSVYGGCKLLPFAYCGTVSWTWRRAHCRWDLSHSKTIR